MSNYNVDTLENKIIVEAQEAIKSLEQIIGYAKESKNAINSLRSATGLKVVDKEAKQATSSLTKLQLVGKTIKSALNFSGILYGAKKIYNFMETSAKNSVDYVETLNLFEVSMGKTIDDYGNIDKVSSQYYTKAIDFQERLNKAFGTNIEETMRYQALYNQMAKSSGIGNEASYIISENLTKLGIDLASLFNKSESAAMEALRAGVLAGQTKPLRNYGLDVTQQSLTPLLGELGIDRAVSDLSQAEKMVLRYISVLKQASAAHGDFAKTIESPANQLKVLKSQFEELKIAIGNLFQGLLGQILPYVNAVIMVIKELVKVIGSLFGFKVSSSNTNLADASGLNDLDDSISNVSAGLGGAASKAKELKAQLMGFDEINNITTETTSSGGGAGGSISSTGIDDKLLAGLKEYDNLMDKVRMKATDIRDKIMDWLGFTKVINPITGEVSWQLREGWTNLKKIMTVIKGIIGLAVAYKVTQLIGTISQLWGVLKGTKTTTSAFGAGLKTLKDTFFKTTPGVGKHAEEVTKLNMSAVKAAIGIAGLAASIYGAYDAMKDYSNGTKDATAAFTQLGISIGGAAASGALIGSVFGPIGTAVGAVTGALIAGVTAWIAYDSEADKSAEKIKELGAQIDKSHNEWVAMKDAINETVTEQMSEINYSKNLVTELKNIADANGKVKEGYEGRAQFILNELNEAYGTEYTMIDGQIQKYNELVSSIEETIDAKKREILAEDYKKMYEEAAKNRDKFFNEYKQAKESFKEEGQELEKLLNKAGMSISDFRGKSTIEMLTMLQTAQGLTIKERTELIKRMNNWGDLSDKLKTATEDWNENCTLMAKYEEYLVAESQGNTAEMERLLNELSIATESELAKQYGYTAYYMDQARNDVSDASHEMYKTQIENLVATTRDIKELTPEQEGAWRYLAEQDRNAYNNALDGLDEDSRKLVETAMNKVITETNNAKPKVEDAAKGVKDAITQNIEGTTKVNIKLDTEIDKSAMINKLLALKNSITSSHSGLGQALLAPVGDALYSAIKNLRGYATGGMPDIGELFVAREAGPELVGKIGRRTAVANNQQIVEAVSRGVYEAVSSAMQGGTTTVQLDVRADEGIIVKKASQGFTEYVTQTGELPFPVPI